MDMAKIGAIAGNGVDRQALSAQDIEARALLISWAAARGFEVAVDDIANLFVRRAGTEPDLAPVLSGSHMDSQPLGGRFDGIFGVLAAFEALEALEQARVETRRSVELVAWTNEEGGRFAPGTMGSMAFTGTSSLEACLPVTDRDGIAFGEALADTLAATPHAARRPFNFPVEAYVEAHIEQGPRLEDAGLTIGVVTGIQGSRWFEVEVVGEAAHAGTTPLRARRDALRDAVAIIQALNEFAHDDADVVRFTVGRLEVIPNSPNTVPQRVVFSIDLRHPEAAVLMRLGDMIDETCRRAATRCDVRVNEIFHRMPCQFASRVIDAVEDAARRLDVPYMRMPSGAFHDAQFMNDVCATGMIFVPCEKGVSHNPAENAAPADLAAGARVLVETLVALANE